MENAISATLKKYQNFIFPLVAVAIGLVLLGLLIIPQALKIPDTNQQIDIIRSSVTALNQKITQLNSVDVNKYQDDLNAALVALPDDKDLPGIMVLIFNLFKNNSLELKGIAFSSQETQAGSSAVFIVKADVSGSKDSLTNTISQLKESPRIIKVNALSASSSLDSTTLEIIISLNSYFQPVPAAQALPLEKPVDLPNQQNYQSLKAVRDFNAKNAALTQATGPAIPLGKPDPFQ